MRFTLGKPFEMYQKQMRYILQENQVYYWGWYTGEFLA